MLFRIAGHFLTRLPGHSHHALLLSPRADVIFKSQKFTDELEKSTGLETFDVTVCQHGLLASWTQTGQVRRSLDW